MPPKLADYPYEFNGIPYEQPVEACFYEVHLVCEFSFFFLFKCYAKVLAKILLRP
jgi:hypothetical protein